MDHYDAGMVLLFVREPPGSLREVGDVECHEDAAPAGCLSQEFEVAQGFQSRISGCRDGVVTQLSQSRSERWGYIGIEQDADAHLYAHHFHPRHLLLNLTGRSGVQFKQVPDLLGIGVGIGACKPDHQRREPQKVLTKRFFRAVLSQELDNFPHIQAGTGQVRTATCGALDEDNAGKPLHSKGHVQHFPDNARDGFPCGLRLKVNGLAKSRL